MPAHGVVVPWRLRQGTASVPRSSDWTGARVGSGLPAEQRPESLDFLGNSYSLSHFIRGPTRGTLWIQKSATRDAVEDTDKSQVDEYWDDLIAGFENKRSYFSELSFLRMTATLRGARSRLMANSAS